MRSSKPGSRCRTKSWSLSLMPSWGCKHTHTHAQTHVLYIHVLTFLLCHTHAHSVAPHWKRGTCFPGAVDLQENRVSETHQLSEPETAFSQATVHDASAWTCAALVDWLYSCVPQHGIQLNAKNASVLPESLLCSFLAVSLLPFHS